MIPPPSKCRRCTDAFSVASLHSRHRALVFQAMVLTATLIVGPSGCQIAATRKNATRPIALRDVRTEFEVTARHRSDERKTRQSTGDEDFRESVFQERLRVEADGHLYHPNLVDFSLALVGGLQQSEFDERLDGVTRSSKQDDTLEEYDVRARLLQNKKFPASLHAVRSRTFDPRPFRSSLETTTTSFDLTWQYVDEKMPTLLQISRTDVDFRPFLSAGERPGNRRNTVLRFETGYHFNKHNILSLNASHEELDESPIDLQYDTDRINLEHRIDFGSGKRHRLVSTLRYFDQQGTFDIERVEWRETLRMQHNDQLRSSTTLEFIDRTQGSLSIVEPVEEKSYLFSTDIEHTLYDSLTSRFSGRVRRQEFGSGLEIDRYAIAGFLDYQKKNRFGVLRGNYSVQFERQERTGGDQTVAVTDEPRTFRDPEPVVITGSNVELASLVLIREDRTETFRNGRDYRLQDFGNRIEIERMPTGRILNEETVLVSYEMTLGGNFDLDTLQQRFGIRQDFDFGLSVYYRLYLQDQAITPAQTDLFSVEEITAHTLGAEYRKDSFHLFAEFEDHDSTISPFESIRVGADYSRRIGDATASVSTIWSDVQFRDAMARSVTLWTVDGRYRHPITRNLNIEAGVEYRNEQDTLGGDNEGVSFDLSAEWFFRTSEIRLTYEYNLFGDSFVDDQSQTLFVRFVRRF